MINRLLTCLLVFLSACNGNFGRPKIPTVLGPSSSIRLYTKEAFNLDYHEYKSAIVICSKASQLQECTAQQLRNSILSRLKIQIDWNFREFESRLFLGRAEYSTALDALELGLSTAATLSGAVETKTILAGILTGFKGTRLSIDRNFLNERTIPAIISKMESERMLVSTDIENKMNLPVSSYSLEEGLSDLGDLYFAGTLLGGIQALSADTSQATATMKAQRSARIRQITH